MPGLIPESLVREAVAILERLNRGYWRSLYWEFQDDADTLYVQINIDQTQNGQENILAISHILRSVLAPLIPSKEHELSWCGSINCHGQSVGGAIGGWRDDWKTLGMDASEDSSAEKVPRPRSS
ncbi:MAG: hypothetical protein U0236_01675 [Nitrospira sp.]